MTFILGLTGSIGMGKSVTAALFRARGVPVHDADATVHALYAGRAAPLIDGAFPGAMVNGVIDRDRLGQRVVLHPMEMARLEAIIHPLVREEEAAFLRVAAERGTPLVVLDVPLLLETGGEERCDGVLVVTAAPDVQRLRVLARPGMTAGRLEALLARQMPDEEKRRRAQFILDTGHGLDAARRGVDDILRALAGRPGRRSVPS